jgi:serine phosphatase RsbU (regulator of sigma subunit)
VMGWSERHGPLLVMLVVIPVLAIGGWLVNHTVTQAAQSQRELRAAQAARSLTLRLQLDEETGLRAYVDARDTLFLEPYAKATAAMPKAFDELRDDLAILGTAQDDTAREEEQRINAAWIGSIAAPLIARPTENAGSLKLQRRGKQLIDAFRNIDQSLAVSLDAQADAADARSKAAIFSTLAYTTVIGVLVTIGAFLLAAWRSRVAREAFETRVLYENQKRIADLLQTAFLNQALPSSSKIALHAIYAPATLETQVGGDWYDAFELPDKRILFSIGDVSGHGIEAAVTMSRARQAIVVAALHEDNPARVLERANETMLLQEAGMVTAICGYVNPSTLEVVYATAGHPPPILVRRGESRSLPHQGVSLGVARDAEYRSFVTHAFPGDLIALYTDGVIESTRDIIAGEARLLEAARLAVKEQDPARAIAGYIFGSAQPDDDVAILTISIRDDSSGLGVVA